MDEPVKRCSKCGKVQPISEFTRDTSKADGLRPSCKTCKAEQDRRWYEANREARREYCHRWYEANRERHAEQSRRWYEANREAKREYDRRYREANRDRLAEQRSRYREDNRDVILERHRESSQRTYDATRDIVLGHYSPTSPPSCACCGTTSGHLGIDHIDPGGGWRHRKEARDHFWRWLIEQDFPPGYQVLCQSCNSSKGRGERCRLKH